MISGSCDLDKNEATTYALSNQKTQSQLDYCKLFFRRCGFFDENVQSITVCHYHHKELTKNFYRYTNKKTCMNVFHDSTTTTKRTKEKSGVACPLSLSRDLWTYYGTLIPEDGFICNTCKLWAYAKVKDAKDEAEKVIDRKKLDDAIKKAEKASKEAKEAKEAAVKVVEHMDTEDIFSSSQASSRHEPDPDFAHSQNTTNDLKKGHINQLFKLDELNLEVESTLRHDIELNESFRPINRSDKTTFYRTMQCLANGFVSILHTIIEDKSLDYKFYQALINSKAVIKLLQGKPLPDKVVIEVIKAVNAASTQKEIKERYA